MEETLKFGVSYAEVIKRRLPIGLSTGFALLVATLLLVFGLPSIYQSRSVVLIEAQEIPQDLVRSLVTSYADQRMQMISQRVLTNTNLATIIQKYDLYQDERASDPLEIVLEKMREDISMVPISADVVDPKQGKSVKATIAFELAYENRSPELAQRVANEIVSLFLNENLKQRSETSAETLGFLSNEAEKLSGEVGSLESKLAAFKQGNVESLPELTNLNLELMNRTEQQISQVESQIQSLQQQRVYLESELAQQKPTTLLMSETGQRILGSADRLKVLESEFVPLSAKYGEAHPDVVSKRKEIESLRREVGSGQSASELEIKLQKAKGDYAIASERYSDQHPDVKALGRQIELLTSELQKSGQGRFVSNAAVSQVPDNPAYIQLKARLEATGSDVVALQAQRNALKAKLAELEDRITKSPEVEREYRTLTRDYDNARAKYQEVLAKKQEAELASNLESKQAGERFTLIEPPVIPEEPSKPNRVAIGVLGFLLSMAGGIGSGALAEAIDGRVYGRGGVTRILGVPPLAVIPKISTVESNRRQRRTVAFTLIVFVLVLLIIAAATHILVSPIDVLFFRALRVLGL